MAWRAYFDKLGVKTVFFSAKQEQGRLDNMFKRNASEAPPASDLATHTGGDESKVEVDEPDVPLLDRLELVEHITSESKRIASVRVAKRKADAAAAGVEDTTPAAQDGAVVGMIGYPNVGKSSIINVLMGTTAAAHGTTRVRVSATPGKTKHFQTIVLTDELILCDCPGLVFPRYA